MCVINGAVIVHRETINFLLHMVWCPLTCPTNNAKQKSCNRVYAGFRLCTKESIVIIYSDTNLKVVFFFLSFQLESNEFFLWLVRLDSCRHLYCSRIAFCWSALKKGAVFSLLVQMQGNFRKNISVLFKSLTTWLLVNVCSVNQLAVQHMYHIISTHIWIHFWCCLVGEAF